MGTQGHDKASFNQGVRACIAWLHKRAGEMADPHARAVLNTAAFHLGQGKPTGGEIRTDAPGEEPK